MLGSWGAAIGTVRPGKALAACCWTSEDACVRAAVPLPETERTGEWSEEEGSWRHPHRPRIARKASIGVKTMTEPSKEELMARIAELEKQAGGRKRGELEFRVGEKGGVSVYGLGRFPVTLYYEQWVRLLDSADGLRSFLEENKGKLKLKNKA